MFHRPLFCFEAFHVRDGVMRNFGYGPDASLPLFLNEAEKRIRIDRIVSEDDATEHFFTTTLRLDSMESWMDHLLFLRDLFPTIFVFHENLPLEAVASLGPKFILNAPCPEIERICHFMLNDGQRAEYARLIQHQQARPFGDAMRQAILLTQTIMNRDELEDIFNPEPDDNDRYLRLAIRLSQEEDARRRQAMEQARNKLQEEWEKVLKKSEPKQVGFPLCICCQDSKATICLVECGHVVLCDDCVREIWTRSTLAKVCPVCKTDCTMITRVIWAELYQEEEEEKREPKKRRRNKKL